MALMRNGHQRVFEYGYFMFRAAQDELRQYQKENLADIAFAHRVSGAPEDKWKKFVERSLSDEPKKPKEQQKKQMTKDDHLKIIQRLKGIGR